MNYILFHKEYSGEYMEMIVDSMKQPCNLVAKTDNGWIEYTQQKKQWTSLRSILKILQGDNRIINWGNHIFREDHYFDLNVPSAVARTSNKTVARRILQSKKARVPKTYFYDLTRELLDGADVEFPLIARPSHHERGRNFLVLNNIRELRALRSEKGTGVVDWYFSEIFNKTHEFRVHTAHGKITFINEKEFKRGNIWSDMAVNAGHWRAIGWSEFNAMICTEALRATEILGLDYAAVDVMYNANNNSMAICELNTDPDVGVPYSAGKYALYFDWLIRHNFPKHFPMNGTSIFYTEMLKG